MSKSSTSTHVQLILLSLCSFYSLVSSFQFNSRPCFHKNRSHITAYNINSSPLQRENAQKILSLQSLFSTNDNTNVVEDIVTIPPQSKKSKQKKRKEYENSDVCMYRRNDGNWRQRKNIDDLHIGQKLFCSKLPNDLRKGKTGAKIFFECGVGRVNPTTKRWNIVNGMVRITNKPNQKATMINKRIKRLETSTLSTYKKDENSKPLLISLYVSNIRIDTGALELVPKMEDILVEDDGTTKQKPKMFSASKLQIGDELTGKVKKVVPYGAFIDVGANRMGLLHIKTIANFLGCFVNGVKGMKEYCDIEVGAEVKVSVQSNERKRLALDFTEDLKKLREDEKKEEAAKEAERIASENAASDSLTFTDEENLYDVEADEAAAWAEFDSIQYNDNSDQDDDLDDEMDEIEHSLGLNFY